MAELPTLANLANLQNETTAVNAINGNSTAITTAFADVLSRSGIAPNQMLSQLDMNSYKILNVPAPIEGTDLVRYEDVEGLVSSLISANETNPTPGKNAILSSNNSSVVNWNNIIQGSIYASEGTNTGEQFGYSFRNSPTTGASIYQPINGGNLVNLQDGIQSVFVVPSTANLEAASGIASYFLNDSTSQPLNTVGVFVCGAGTVANAPIWGINTLISDNGSYQTHSRTGQILIGYECDINVTGTNTQVIGMSVGGNGLAQPSVSNAYIANTLGAGLKWDVGFNTQDGAANIALLVGSLVANGTSNPSQLIEMLYFDSSSVRQNVRIQASDGFLSMVNSQSEINLRLGNPGFSKGALSLGGLTSGLITISPQLVAGTATLTLPNSPGTFAVSASSPLALDTTTGNLTLPGPNISITGSTTLYNSTSVPSGGTTGAGLMFSSTADLGVFFGSGLPTLSAAQGSLYIRTDGSSTSTRMYININGSTTWTNVTTAA